MCFQFFLLIDVIEKLEESGLFAQILLLLILDVSLLDSLDF